jgi:hypothetical protein
VWGILVHFGDIWCYNTMYCLFVFPTLGTYFSYHTTKLFFQWLLTFLGNWFSLLYSMHMIKSLCSQYMRCFFQPSIDVRRATMCTVGLIDQWCHSVADLHSYSWNTLIAIGIPQSIPVEAGELQEDGLIVMSGMELSQTCGFYMFDVFDTAPLIPFHPLQWACPPIAPPTSLLWSIPMNVCHRKY